jgi:hypothetical protein
MAQPVIHVNGTLADVVDEVTREMVQQQLLIEIGPHLKVPLIVQLTVTLTQTRDQSK